MSCRTLILLASVLALPALAQRDHDIEVDDYFTLTYVMQPAWSPDGKHVAFVDYRWDPQTKKRNGDLWVTHVASRKTKRLTFDPAFESHPMWSPDSQWIFFEASRKRAGAKGAPWNGKKQVWRIGVDGRDEEAVTRVKTGIKRAELSPDGKRLYYAVGRKHVGKANRKLKRRYSSITYGHGVVTYTTLWELDLSTWRAKKLASPDRVVNAFTVSADGRRIAMITTPNAELITNEGWSRVDIWDRKTGKITALDDQLWRKEAPSPYGWLDAPSWSADGKALAFTVDFDGYPGELLVARFRDGSAPAIRRLKRPDELTLHSGATPRWRGTSKDLLFVGEKDAVARIYAIPGAAGDKPKAGYAATAGKVVVGSIAVSRDGKRVVANGRTPTNFGDLWIGKAGKGVALKQLTESNPQVARWKLPKMERFTWKSPDGTPVEGILELPPGYKPGKPLPTVILLHGGPASAARFSLRFWGYGRTFLAAQGYAVLLPNYRGSTGYGDKFLTDLIGRKNDIDVIDILAGVDALVAKGIADPKRLGVAGWSNGGYLTNCLITRTERFKAASSGAGVFDVIMQWGIEDTPGHVVNYQKGFPWNRFDSMRKASPLFSADKIKTPTLIHVGENDPRCPPEHSRALHRALHHYVKVPVELLIYPGTGHSLRKWAHKKAKMEWDLAWFKKYLLGNGAK